MVFVLCHLDLVQIVVFEMFDQSCDFSFFAVVENVGLFVLAAESRRIANKPT